MLPKLNVLHRYVLKTFTVNLLFYVSILVKHYA
jgi:hypothetical protein